MKKIGIFYGSATGTTADVARRIARYAGVAPEDIHDVASTAPSVLGEYARVILGSSTWGDGQPEDSWLDFLDGAESLDLRGRTIAL
ncbi:MAG: flavodoxin domain-containing protein, partial [Muribaculaceae bacterium]|nr:flavodoxin domain-containing protein [Muribaculaceae bacterium]